MTMAKAIEHQRNGYTRTARLLHWVTAGFVLYQIPVGVLIANFELGPLYDLHKSLGTLILLLTIIRLAWRWAHPAPALPDDIPVAQHRAAVAMHWGLYALLLVQTSIGWIGTAAYPAPVPFFGLFEFPQIWWEDRPLSDRLFALHFWIGILMAVLLVGHIGAALYHHFVRQDEVLQRICGARLHNSRWLPGPREPSGEVLGLIAIV